MHKDFTRQYQLTTMVSGRIVAALIATTALTPVALIIPRPALAQQVVADGINVTASGTIDTGTTINEAGMALRALNGGTIISDGPLTITTGGGSAHGASAQSGGKVTISGGSTITVSGNSAYGMRSEDAGSTITATDTTVTLTSPSSGAQGIYARRYGRIDLTNVTVNTLGTGVAAGHDGTVMLNGGSVTTTGAGMGLVATSPGSQLTASDIDVTTSGTAAYGAVAQVGGTLSFTGGTITTSGATGVGLLAAEDSTLTVNGASVTTSGNNAYGALAQARGTLSVTGGTIATSGATGVGLFAVGDSTVTMNGATVTTSGNNAYGALAQARGTLSITGGSIATSGAGAHGLRVAGAGSTLTVDGTAVTTSGAGAHAATTSAGGALSATDTTLKASGTAVSALFVVGDQPDPADPADPPPPIPLSTADITGGSLTSGPGPTIGVAGHGTITLTGTTVTGDDHWLQVGSLNDFTPAARVAITPAILDIDDPDGTTPIVLSVTPRLGGTPGLANVTVSGSVVTGSALTAAGSVSNVVFERDSTWNVTGDSLITDLVNDASLIQFRAPSGGGVQDADGRQLHRRGRAAWFQHLPRG